MSEVELTGLDGGNPLAFLAALGTARTLAEAWTDGEVRLAWTAGAVWHPILHVSRPCNRESVAEALDARLRAPEALRPFGLSDDLKVSPLEYRAYAAAAARDALVDRRTADFAACFGSEAISDKDQIADTALRTMSGAGHQHFLKFMRDLVTITDRTQIARALFGPWVYSDPGPSLRWDPADDRRYALRWLEPSGDPVRTERGANRLAIEGLSLLPVAPVGRRLHTTGFTGHGRRDTYWTWPLWDGPLSLDSIRSVLSMGELQEPEPPRARLAARGVVEVFRSQRLTIGKYRNFSPARSV